MASKNFHMQADRSLSMKKYIPVAYECSGDPQVNNSSTPILKTNGRSLALASSSRPAGPVGDATAQPTLQPGIRWVTFFTQNHVLCHTVAPHDKPIVTWLSNVAFVMECQKKFPCHIQGPHSHIDGVFRCDRLGISNSTTTQLLPSHQFTQRSAS